MSTNTVSYRPYSVLNDNDIEKMVLINQKFKIINKIIHGDPLKVEVTLKISLFCKEDIKLWVRACPSFLNNTLKAVNRKYRGQIANAPDPEIPCIAVFIISHNHNIISVDALRLKRVHQDKEKLIALYNTGHSPATALENLKLEIQMGHENYEELFADCNICPDYNYCYYIFMTEFKNQYGSIDFNDKGKDFLINKLIEYNKAVADECVKANINGICTPLFKRIHENISTSAEIVFMDSIGTVDHDGSKVFILTIHNDCGGLPLGLIVTWSESANNIVLGLEMLKSMIGNKIFNGKVEGPQVLMTDSEAEHIAIKAIRSKSK